MYLLKSRHAPKGGEDDNGKHFKGGEFAPKEPGAVTITIPRHMRKMDDAEFIEAAKAYAREHYAGKTVVNTSDHSSIDIPWQGIKHAFSHKTMSRNEAAAVMELGELVRTAKKTYETSDRHARENIRAVHFYQTDIEVEGKKVGINIVVREAEDGKRYYDHYELKRPAGQSGKLGKSQGSLQPFTGRSLVHKKIPPQNDARKIKKALPHLYLLRKAARTLDGRIDFNGLPVSIETGRSRSRAWKNPHDGSEGMSRMWLPYGYIQGTLGVDGDQLDVFVGPDRTAPYVYIINIMKAPDFTKFDEQKCFLGVESPEEAKRVFFASYNDPRFFGSMTVMPFDEFKEKVFSMKGQMIKSHIQAYTRHTSSGATVQVREHEDSRRTYHNPDAPVGEFGAIPYEVAAAAGIPAAPIRLVRGKQIDQHRGFGKEHIAVQHGNEIRQAGYQSEEEFVKDVASNYNAIYDAGKGRIALVADGKTGQKIHIIEARYSRGQKFYTVVTGYIAERPKFDERRYRLLWKRIMKAIRQMLRMEKLRKSGEALCKQLGDSLGVDWKKYDLDEFCDGIFVEEEKASSAIEAAKIVLANLDKDPHFYSKQDELTKALAPHLYLLKRSR